MRGEVLHYDEAQGFGFIAGADGNRYTFRREDLRRSFPLARGTVIEFRETGDRAQDVFPPVEVAVAAIGSRACTDTAPSPAALTATPIAMPATRPAPQRYGRNALGGGDQEHAGLWGSFRAGVTTNYANFHGRARRKEYWGFALFYVLGMILLTLAGLAIDAALGNFDYYGSEVPVATIVVVLLAFLASMVPGIAIGVRRFHDIGLSGWFYLAMCVVGLVLGGSVMILATVLGLIPSQKSENKWGPAPDGVDSSPPQAG